jgi:lipid-binding SYLF domain-containing protein
MMNITILLVILEVVTNVIKKGYGIAGSYGECVLNDMVENSYKVNVAVDLLSKDSEWEELLK